MPSRLHPAFPLHLAPRHSASTLTCSHTHTQAQASHQRVTSCPRPGGVPGCARTRAGGLQEHVLQRDDARVVHAPQDAHLRGWQRTGDNKGAVVGHMARGRPAWGWTRAPSRTGSRWRAARRPTSRSTRLALSRLARTSGMRFSATWPRGDGWGRAPMMPVLPAAAAPGGWRLRGRRHRGFRPRRGCWRGRCRVARHVAGSSRPTCSPVPLSRASATWLKLPSPSSLSSV